MKWIFECRKWHSRLLEGTTPLLDDSLANDMRCEDRLQAGKHFSTQMSEGVTSFARSAPAEINHRGRIIRAPGAVITTGISAVVTTVRPTKIDDVRRGIITARY